ncbi:Predicted DNA-binding protein, MmcQ/YjbR family [Brevibacterium siliguriense]|uniref:Predicted DNA-binding protein, MmcQ/YjbR family n=1 Tax=Brevibacterium siliguriense TaxID=1136497 RepID=A0A1H1NYN3_9MICO|nr:MmcQ/YjbR family DNA-binding protein [Brevibacterium siliguriense]SDS04088.1 Predicted DNA-binding protein, MmcQ/YjbR family [Brevibacterium siliguriense]
MDPDTVLRLAHDQAMQYPSVELDYPFGPDNAVYKVRGKMFMMAYELRGIPSLNLKIDPLDGEVLRDVYAEISPGYHMNKKHWITVAGEGDGGGDGNGSDAAGNRLDADLLHDLVLESYCLVVAKMPKKDRPVDPDTFGGRGDD